ncbi:prepilin-type N-terminal cleavage/methylation domain-containing protein [Thalassotalea nanhaiensis]|uniref:Prepilin-type N-terminal cleavage/methylation domain-containing protein n=1 Tax=Thalassotalea nanhaiensis TaxID=3065648 RepID=A0ABY9TFT7_9GAMM|nr:prepilin-type N-terminal cleavage/methylation domain-containing protein [Colwelliaceae bacterium SQ345]
MKKTQGITLIEILITILIMSILASVAGPSFIDSFKKRRLVSAVEELYSHLQLARSEALSGKILDPKNPKYDPIFVSFSGSGTSWSYGLSQGTTCNPTITVNTDANACVLVVEVGNDVSAEDNVLMRVDGSEYEDVSLVVYGSGSVEFNPVRGTADSRRFFKFTSSSGESIWVRLGRLGNVTMCSSDFSEYSECPSS